ncbi:MAG: hypothetical protein J4473_00080 [Candidatus Aenigmarchaeota archaeon]|nr:hypothetical protein [Candidatus Aenigmarchaeota archaeon]
MVLIEENGKHMTTFITISNDEYESMKRTLDILNDEELMSQINQSRHAKSRSWKDVKKELGL